MITQYIYYYNHKRSMKYLNYFSPKTFKVKKEVFLSFWRRRFGKSFKSNT
ncbi:IS3 family transposase [Candidatus Phytoplasma pruni]